MFRDVFYDLISLSVGHKGLSNALLDCQRISKIKGILKVQFGYEHCRN